MQPSQPDHHHIDADHGADHHHIDADHGADQDDYDDDVLDISC